MSDRTKQIGIDRLIRLNWLEQASALVMSGTSPADIKAILQNDIKDAFRSDTIEKRGSLDKTLTILMRVWVNPPRESAELYAAGLELLKRLPKQVQVAVHWGMIMAVYPFWAAVAGQVGRLLKLQESVVAAQVQRRLREQYGERETVSRRTRYVLRAFVDWGVLGPAKSSGVYEQLPPIPIGEKALAAWLIETAMVSQGTGTAVLKSLAAGPHFFPFRFAEFGADELVTASPSLEIVSHNLDEELVALKKQPRSDADSVINQMWQENP